MSAALTTPLPFSTPATHIFSSTDHSDTAAASLAKATSQRHSDQQISDIYEIERTIAEIQVKGWQRIALQFPDRMLGDGVRVYELLRTKLLAIQDRGGEENKDTAKNAAGERVKSIQLWILADTSYSPCCVDAVAAEHANAEVVVHYGNACLSEVRNVEVLYVFTRQVMDVEKTVARFEACYMEERSEDVEEQSSRAQECGREEQVILMADCEYQSHVPTIVETLRQQGWQNVVGTEIMHGSIGEIPNRKICWRPEHTRDLNDYSIFYIGAPPSSLLLTMASRVKDLLVCPIRSFASNVATRSVRQHTQMLLRKRYGILTSLTTTPIIGILINTLSIASLLQNIDNIKSMIEQAGKKSYTVVVGKVNVEKLANFSEVGGWVGVGCWESGLGVREGHHEGFDEIGGISGSGGFWKPVITPFELGFVLQSDKERVWGGEWKGGLDGLSHGPFNTPSRAIEVTDDQGRNVPPVHDQREGDDYDLDSEPESAPPDFDLRTGRYVAQSISRPMRRPVPIASTHDSATVEAEVAPMSTRPDEKKSQSSAGPDSGLSGQHVADNEKAGEDMRGNALTRRPKQDLSSAVVNGVRSPGADFLRVKTWRGLGSDFVEGGSEVRSISDENGGTLIEEGRSGIARGYVVNDEGERKARR